MKKISILIVDDEPLAHSVIEGYCSKIEYLDIVGNCYDSISTINFLHENRVDAIILDIQMPDLTGLEFLDSIKTKSPKIIFVTGFTEYALDSFEYDNVIDYLHKPVRFSRFIRAIERLKSQLELENNLNSLKPVNLDANKERLKCILVKQDKITYKIKLGEILYIQSWGNYIKIYLKNEKNKIVRKTLSEIEEELKYSGFVRIHHSYVVNIVAVNGIQGNLVLLRSMKLPISRGYQIIAKEAIMNQ